MVQLGKIASKFYPFSLCINLIYFNREINSLPFKTLEVGEYDCFVNEEDQISVTRWKDSTYVIFITNYSSTEDETKYFKRGASEETTMPMVAFDYRGNMISVCRWWLTIFFFFIDIVIVNAWKIFVHDNERLSRKQCTVSYLLVLNIICTYLY